MVLRLWEICIMMKWIFIESIAGLPDYEKGYMKSLELAQLTMPGTDLIEELFDDYYNQRLNRYVSFSKEK